MKVVLPDPVLAADDDGLVLAHGQAQELGVVAPRLEVDELVLEGQQLAVFASADDGGAIEESLALEVVETTDQFGRLANGDRHRATRHRGRDRDLHAFAARQGGREKRTFRVDLLIRVGRQGGREGQAALEGQLGLGDDAPAACRLDQHLARPVDADFENAGGIELGPERTQELDHRRRVARPPIARRVVGPKIRGHGDVPTGVGCSAYTAEKSTSRAT